MNEPDERRVVAALHELTGGITVTEHDVLVMGARLDERLEPPDPRRRVALVAAVAAALVLGGYLALERDWLDRDAAPPADRTTQTPGDTLRAELDADPYLTSHDQFLAGAPPSAEDLAGVWMLRHPYRHVMFVGPDGDWRSESPTSDLAFGTSDLAGDSLTRRVHADSVCVRWNDLLKRVQPWRVAVSGDGSIRMQLPEPRSCTPADEREVWDRLDVGAPVPAYLLAAARTASWRPVTSTFAWQGLYLAPESGHVLEVDREGRYRYYDAPAPLARASDRGELEASVGEVSASCVGGEFTGAVEAAEVPGEHGYVFPFEAVRFTTERNSCASDLAAQEVWVNLSSR